VVNSRGFKVPADYYIILAICVIFCIIALFLDSPKQILDGFIKIQLSRSVLITDYIALSGISAALVNAAVLVIFMLILLIGGKCPANGKIIAALFVTMGFSLFGKNMLNSIPRMLGVWISGKCFHTKIQTLMVRAMFSTTIAPIVSEIAFLKDDVSIERYSIAFGVGLLIGFIFPAITESVRKLHNNYCLYNGGIAGGFIATFCVCILRSTGIEIMPEDFWDTSNSDFMAALTYSLSAVLIIFGFASDRPKNAIAKYKKLLKEKDQNDCDYFLKYGYNVYLNIGILCALSTTVMLLLKIPINGPVLGGILTVAGFGACGKHFNNTLPVLIGSTAGAYFNYLELTDSLNCLAILFATGLAPISGKYGWFWGIVVGFFHVSIALFVGNLNGGLNLYNNGFAGIFVAITIVPLIISSKQLLEQIRNSIRSRRTRSAARKK
jgi:hypothetical protein